MSGTVWMFSDQIDDEDIDFMQRGTNCPYHGELRKMSQTMTERCRKMSQEGMNYD